MRYIAWVLVPDEEDAAVDAEERLAPFHVEAGGEQLGGPCHCINRGARQDANAAGAQSVGMNKSELYEKWYALRSTDGPSWTEYSARFYSAAQPVFDAHPLKGRPDPTCEECGGSGEDPEELADTGRWDYCDIGDTIPVGDALSNLSEHIPASLVTPDGRWLENRKHDGLRNEMRDVPLDQWVLVVEKELAANRDAWVVVCEMHF